MTISETPGVIKKFKRTMWVSQMTFATPLKELDVFVPKILSSNDPIKEATVTVDGYAFKPRNLADLLSKRMLSGELRRDTSITAIGTDQVCELLHTALSDWLDFLFMPVLKLFVIYADHDEYTTFFANTKSNLERIRSSLIKSGFKQVEGYQRNFRK